VYERYTHWSSRSISNIIILEKLDQEQFFILDPSLEKLPQLVASAHQDHRVTQVKLGTYEPPKETKIAGMSNIFVNSVFDENMIVVFFLLNVVVERFPSSIHGSSATQLA
jgi:hypothetical protein